MPRYTQGLMDLGATVCLTRRPNCLLCPVQPTVWRSARACLKVTPSKPASSSAAQSLWLLHARTADGATCGCSKRPAPGVWAGLYCLPVFDSEELLLAPACLRACNGQLRDAPVCACADPQGSAPAPGAAGVCPPQFCRGGGGGAGSARAVACAGLACTGAQAAGRRCGLIRRLPEAASSSRCRLSVTQRLAKAGQLFHQVHRPVLAACAADGYGDIAAVVAASRSSQWAMRHLDMVEHLPHLGLCSPSSPPPVHRARSAGAVRARSAGWAACARQTHSRHPPGCRA
jgi:hypothetical protein